MRFFRLLRRVSDEGVKNCKSRQDGYCDSASKFTSPHPRWVYTAYSETSPLLPLRCPIVCSGHLIDFFPSTNTDTTTSMPIEHTVHPHGNAPSILAAPSCSRHLSSLIPFPRQASPALSQIPIADVHLFHCSGYTNVSIRRNNHHRVDVASLALKVASLALKQSIGFLQTLTKS